jgi:host factor-I protein
LKEAEMAKAINLQEMFLNQVRKESIPVTIFLTGGVQIKGLIRGFDAFTILLDSPGKATQLVYKHAVSAVLPSRGIPGYKPPTAREFGEGDGDQPE